ncbi:hypothetical protein QE363_000368 [Sphingomonas sp. SORGH_AS870]|nr:hypothetical protein [Sphingomonas sp. SORGH_AS_0870]
MPVDDRRTGQDRVDAARDGGIGGLGEEKRDQHVGRCSNRVSMASTGCPIVST